MDESKLTPANESPWYVLMTLYGEQDGEEVDPATHRGNLTAWSELEYAPSRTSANNDWIDFGKHSSMDRKNWPKLQQKFAIRTKDAEAKRPTNGQPVVLTQLRFENPLVLTDYAFGAHVTFEDCVFEDQVILDNCYFDAGVTFKNVQFRKGLSFKKSGCRTAFEATDVTTQNDMTFAGSRFGGASTWKSLMFEPNGGDTSKRQLSFLGARFDDYADFAEVVFDCYAVFQDTTFAQRAMFSRSRFKRGVSFRSAVFRDYAYFNDAQFTAAPNTKTRHINFTESRFELPPTFRNAKFSGEYPNLAGAILHDRSVFTTHEGGWPRQKDLRPRAETATATCEQVALESTATLRALCSKQSLPEEEHFFFRREMQLVGSGDPWGKGLPYRIFGWVSDYGHSILLPANCLLAFWFVGAFVIYEATDFGGFESMGYSFANMFKFLGLQRTYFDLDIIRAWPGWLKGASATQTVLSFILLFFLGLGLRTRFRLR